MKEYVSKEKLFVAMCFNNVYLQDMSQLEFVNKLPSEYVEEVKHAKWLNDTENFGISYCSNCYKIPPYEYVDCFNYCPNCSAKNGRKGDKIMKLSDLIEQLETCRRRLGDNGGEAEVEAQLYNPVFDDCYYGTIDGTYETFNNKAVMIGNITDKTKKKREDIEMKYIWEYTLEELRELKETPCQEEYDGIVFVPMKEWEEDTDFRNIRLIFTSAHIIIGIKDASDIIYAKLYDLDIRAIDILSKSNCLRFILDKVIE